MSIVSQLIAAFKREAEKTPPVPNPYPGGPTGGNGPDLSTADDGHEFRQPPPSVGGKPLEEVAVDGGDAADEAAAKLNSNSVNPLTVLRDKTMAKDLESDDKLGDFEVQDAIADKEPPPPPPPPIQHGTAVPPPGFDKVESSGIAEDSDAGGEVAAKGNIDPAFTRRLRFSPETDPSVQSSDPEEGGEIAGLRRPPQDFKFADTAATEDPDAGGESAPEGFGRSGPSDIPIIKPFDRPPPPPPQEIPAGPLGEQVTPIDDGGIEGIRRPIDVPPVNPNIPTNPPAEEFREEPGATDDPDAGGEVVDRFRPPVQVKGENAGIAEDPDAGGEVVEPFRPPTGGYIGETEKNLGVSSSDPEEGGEVGGPFRQTSNTSFADKLAQGSGTVVSSDLEEGGEFTKRNIGNVKYEDIKVVDGPAGGDEITEIAKGKAQPGDFTFTHVYDKASPVLGREGVEPPGDFKVEMEEVLASPPAAPGGVPIPYPLADESGDDGLANSLARKAGEGQKDFLKIELKEAFISRDASDGIDGESTDKDHKGEVTLARRTGVKDAHDRPADVGSPEPKPVNALAADDDDDLESNTLLNLSAKPVAAGMQPGLAGRIVENLDADGAAELDGDADADTDESEL